MVAPPQVYKNAIEFIKEVDFLKDFSLWNVILTEYDTIVLEYSKNDGSFYMGHRNLFSIEIGHNFISYFIVEDNLMVEEVDPSPIIRTTSIVIKKN